MANNLGIDFGSTYTMLSYYDEVNQRVNAIQTENGSCYIPSVACLDEFGETLLMGQEARQEMTANHSLHPFRAFKMLLSEQDKGKLEAQGYADPYSPARITREFLEHFVSVACNACDTQQFDSAVICIPEVWTRTPSYMSGRSILLDICKQFGSKNQKLLKKIKVVTEPVAASAYYAHHYRKLHKAPYRGKLIIIDYGGGTLDITLTDVSPSPDGKSMMIDAFWRTGAGEHHPDRIGDAGLAYMEKVTALALEQAGFPNAPIDGHFLRVKDRLENKLMNSVNEITAAVNKYRLQPEKFGKDQREFTFAPYKGKKVIITYAMLYQVFESVIKPVLNKNLAELKQKLDKLHLDPRRDMEKIKIAVVGGFGQFPLVQKAVWDFFGYSGNDMDIAHGAEGGKQDAISFGAALIAAGEVTVSTYSRYSIGLRVTIQGKEYGQLAIKCRDHVDYDKMYPVGGAWQGVNYGGSTNPEDDPWVFAINDSDENFSTAYKMIPRPEICYKLQSDITPGYRYAFGFSMDESEIYTLHIVPWDPNAKKPIFERGYPFRLGNFNDIFGMNAIFDEKKMLKILK